MRNVKHLDLFSGIGGFALAAEMVWEKVDHIFCDNEPFSQAILKKHWPNAPIYGDIKELSGTGLGQIDILTGGFPCQPFSAAGQRRGKEDDRHLWPEMLRVIRETNPTWVIGENVRGLITWNDGVVLDEVYADLEGLNYEVGSFIIPACALNAPHRRDRVWIIAHARGGDAGGNPGSHEGESGTQGLQKWNEVEQSGQPSPLWDASDPAHVRLQGIGDEVFGQGEKPNDELSHGRSGGGNTADVKNSLGLGRRGGMEGDGQVLECKAAEAENAGSDWSLDWLEVATRLCAVDDGIPAGMARPRGWRNAALKGGGNAIVPQVAAQIMQSIEEQEQWNQNKD